MLWWWFRVVWGGKGWLRLVKGGLVVVYGGLGWLRVVWWRLRVVWWWIRVAWW